MNKDEIMTLEYALLALTSARARWVKAKDAGDLAGVDPPAPPYWPTALVLLEQACMVLLERPEGHFNPRDEQPF